MLLFHNTALARDRPTDPIPPPSFTCGVKMNETSASSGFAPAVIVGGKVAIPGAWPWQVAILCKNCTALTCGGTLVSAYHVITAAHCIPSDTDPFVKDYKVGMEAICFSSATIGECGRKLKNLIPPEFASSDMSNFY